MTHMIVKMTISPHMIKRNITTLAPKHKKMMIPSMSVKTHSTPTISTTRNHTTQVKELKHTKNHHLRLIPRMSLATPPLAAFVTQYTTGSTTVHMPLHPPDTTKKKIIAGVMLEVVDNHGDQEYNPKNDYD